MKKSEIKIAISLDENKLPNKIEWQADDDSQNKLNESKAILLSLFEKDSLETVRIDLWTTEMKVNEMDRFFFQTLKGLCDTYYRSTNNEKLAAQMQNFTRYFGEETGIIPKENT